MTDVDKLCTLVKTLIEMGQQQSERIAEQNTAIARLTETVVSLSHKLYQQSLVIAEIRSAQEDARTRR